MLYLWYQYTIEPTKYAGRRIWERLSYVSKENDVNGKEVYGRAEGEVMQQTLRQKDQVWTALWKGDGAPKKQSLHM